jgi:hypothetical protein
MTTLRMPARPRANRAGAEARPHPVTPHDEPPHDGPNAGHLLDGELLDLYIAILIVVPVALFLKSLLF